MGSSPNGCLQVKNRSKQMKCWICNANDTEVGHMFCPTCQPAKSKSEPEPGPKQQRKPQVGTLLYFCSVCHVEVYRHAHAPANYTARTKRMEDIKKQARLGLVQHMMRVGHTSAALSGDLWINEESGDDGFEVAATGEKCPAHMQASRIFGMGSVH
jgi:hypothetical protein